MNTSNLPISQNEKRWKWKRKICRPNIKRRSKSKSNHVLRKRRRERERKKNERKEKSIVSWSERNRKSHYNRLYLMYIKINLNRAFGFRFARFLSIAHMCVCMWTHANLVRLYIHNCKIRSNQTACQKTRLINFRSIFFFFSYSKIFCFIFAMHTMCRVLWMTFFTRIATKKRRKYLFGLFEFIIIPKMLWADYFACKIVLWNFIIISFLLPVSIKRRFHLLRIRDFIFCFVFTFYP